MNANRSIKSEGEREMMFDLERIIKEGEISVEGLKRVRNTRGRVNGEMNRQRE